MIDPTLSANTTTELIFTRCNTYYLEHKKLWEKALKAYNGGRPYLKRIIRKHPSETPEEYRERVDSAYNLNIIKYSVNEFGNYIFSKTPRRKDTNEEIVSDFDRQKKSVNEVMWKLFKYHNLCGVVWALVDMPVLDGNVIDLATKEREKIRPWCKILSPLSVPDWCFDKFGNLEWVIIEDIYTEKSNPTLKPVRVKKRTLYTKDYFQVFTQVLSDGNNYSNGNAIKVSPPQKNVTGVVPVIPYSDILFDADFNNPEIDDMLTICDAVLCGESELLTNILKQTYGQLVLPMSSHSMVAKVKARLARESIDIHSKIVDEVVRKELGIELSRTKAVFEDEMEKGTARYIQPTGATTQSIIDHNDRLIGLSMKMTGFLLGTNTTQRASADSKAIDNASLASQLIRIASKLQEVEISIWKLFNLFEPTIKVPTVEYNKDFDIHEFNAIISGLVELGNVNAGDAYKRQYKRTATHVLNNIHHIPDDIYENIMGDIEADKESNTPPTFSDNPTHKTEASGSRPDAIAPMNDYKKGTTNNVGKTDSI